MLIDKHEADNILKRVPGLIIKMSPELSAIDKVLDDIGDKKLKIVVVAYEDGIHALLEENKQTSQLLTKLANRGAKFKACRISMRAWGLNEKRDEIRRSSGLFVWDDGRTSRLAAC